MWDALSPDLYDGDWCPSAAFPMHKNRVWHSNSIPQVMLILMTSVGTQHHPNCSGADGSKDQSFTHFWNDALYMTGQEQRSDESEPWQLIAHQRCWDFAPLEVGQS